MLFSGSLVHTFVLCKRKTWLLSHQITGDQENEFLLIGRLYSETSYKREKKEVMIDNNKVDMIKEENGILTIVETKKSSKLLNTAKIQLLHYLYDLENKGYKVKGEIRIPKEKKIIPIDLNEQAKNDLDKIYSEMDQLIEMDKPPVPEWIGACRNCSYNEFCWS